LSIVRDVATQNGGRAWAEATDGGGACFVVTIPITESDPVSARDIAIESLTESEPATIVG